MTIAVENLHKRYGGVRALDDVSFEVRCGEIFGIAGPDGCGKTTLADIITGFVRADAGSIALDGTPLPRRAAAIARRGVARTFQHPRLIFGLNAVENAAFGSRPAAGRTAAAAAKEMLERLGLRARPTAGIAELSAADRRRVELVRALARSPSLLVLDEPSAGLSFAEAEHVRGVVADYASGHDAAVLLIERDLSSCSRICGRAIVLQAGRVVAHGTPETLRRDQDVLDAYLGVEWRQ